MISLSSARRLWRRAFEGCLRRRRSTIAVVQSNEMLDGRSIANCRVFENREAMVRALASSGGVGAEVGVWDGDFSVILLQTLAPTRLHLIDIAIRDRIRARFAREIGGEVLAVHQGDSVEVLNRFPDGHFDWIYIDGDHSRHGVERDVAAAVRKIKWDGLLFFNDYTMGDHNVPSGFYPYGIIPVVNDLCLHHGFEMLGFALHHQMYCDVAIRRSGGR